MRAIKIKNIDTRIVFKICLRSHNFFMLQSYKGLFVLLQSNELEVVQYKGTIITMMWTHHSYNYSSKYALNDWFRTFHL